MGLTFNKLSKTPKNFKQLSGLEVEEFREVVEKVRGGWENLERKKKAKGRPNAIASLEDKVLCVCIYYRTYITDDFLGYLFDLDNSNICRFLKKMEPIIAKSLAIKKDRSLNKDEVLKLLADVTEKPTQRPKSNSKQKQSYSGKKKRHTLKTEIIIKDNREIISVSKTHRGSTPDFEIRKQEKLLPQNDIKYADSGYQAWQKIQSQVVIPHKKKRNIPLTTEQKQYNKQLASLRIKVENKIRQLKIFKILSHVYRNFQKKLHLRFNSIAGLLNLKCGF